ncbi:MAG: UvrD-helicase domain-containing protein [Cytophagales bacterium]|nr:UvrD-helicase domain-containing protein [Cytophagales bacterium]
MSDTENFFSQDKSFVVYRASAGSGKTFTLTLEYLKLALEQPQAFRKILGVTFTNKATEEMKTRILQVLKDISSGEDHPMVPLLLEALDLPDRQALKLRGQEALIQILHHYGQFSIVTIDSFFHQVIRSFAREMGLQGTFAIDLDIDKVIQEVIDLMLAEVGNEDKKELRGWLTQFAESKVEEGKAWDFRGDITALARELMKDHFKPFARQVLALGEEKGFFGKLIKDLHQEQRAFERKCDQYCQTGLEAIQSAGGIDQFSRKASGPAGLFLKVSQKDYTISDGRRNALGEPTKWLTKDGMKNAALQDTLTTRILPVYKDLIHYIDEQMEEYQSIGEVLRHFYAFGILTALDKKLQDYRDEKDVMLIADLPDFLRLIIDESDTPYIYEKIGGYYSNYLIDEFQDTSGFQWNNFKPLVKNSADTGDKSLVVGDTKQSIYRWRGGNWKLLNGSVAQDVGEHHVRFEGLGVNWRSAAEIVQFNNWFFGNLKTFAEAYFGEVPDEGQALLEQVIAVYDGVSQEVARKEVAGLVQIQYLEEENWQETSIAKTIALVEDLQRQGYQLRDMAILTRTQREGKRIADAFMLHKSSSEADDELKYDVVSSEALYLYSSHAVKFLISMITWLNQEKNTIALAEWVHEYRRFVKHSETGLHEIFGNVNEWAQVVPPAFVEQKNYLKRLPLYELVESLVRIFELNELHEEYTYIQGFQDAVLDYSKNERGDIPSFLIWWDNVRKERAIQVADQNDAIKILTLHKSKGLEFPIVIIPFLNWKLDHDAYSKDEILWVQPPEHEILERLPVVPLKYSSKMESTYWHEAYWEEKINAFLDSVNLLYVAFTRSVDALYVFGEMPKTARIAHIGQLTKQILDGAEAWNEGTLTYTRGTLPTREVEPSISLEYGLIAYPSHSWRGKVAVQMKGAAELSDRDFEAQKAGIDWHSELARIETYAEGEQYDVSAPVLTLIQSSACRPFFEKVDEVKMEVPVLLPGGVYYRIDRLIRKGDTWYVIDFKTGEPKNADQHQVRRYMEILQSMGFNDLKGVLIYLDPIDVKEVA